jgi:hypothetical protein
MWAGHPRKCITLEAKIMTLRLSGTIDTLLLVASRVQAWHLKANRARRGAAGPLPSAKRSDGDPQERASPSPTGRSAGGSLALASVLGFPRKAPLRRRVSRATRSIPLLTAPEGRPLTPPITETERSAF